mgnify:FL=1
MGCENELSPDGITILGFVDVQLKVQESYMVLLGLIYALSCTGWPAQMAESFFSNNFETVSTSTQIELAEVQPLMLSVAVYFVVFIGFAKVVSLSNGAQAFAPVLGVQVI